MVKYYIKVVNHETYYFREQHEKIVYYIVKRHQLEAVASLRRAVRPGCHYFGLTPFYDTFQGKKNGSDYFTENFQLKRIKRE